MCRDPEEERDRLGGPEKDFSLEETLGLSSEGNMSPPCSERRERVCPAEETAGPKAWRWDPGFTEWNLDVELKSGRGIRLRRL